MTLPLILYDIPGKNGQTWNPMPMRTRICLNIKEVPFKTEWVEYPDIKPTLLKLGAAPSRTLPDGSPYYTLPVISDPNNLTADGKPTIVSDSQNIAEYLDEQYPSKTRLIPEGTKALQKLFVKHFFKNFTLPSAPIYSYLFLTVITDTSEPYFRSTGEAFLGKKLEETCQEGSKEREEAWENVRKGLSQVAAILDRNGDESVFVMGKIPSFADIVIATALHKIASFTPRDWEEVCKWDGGRWKAHYQACAGWFEKLDN
ncbi:hypothetical protein M422DRAFT_156323 [Sphaerobolus stellatus SS14]|nr:hypothetical protein M422DRAFT_156323 [Sphaerobolus stellatus SS14]